MMTKGTDLDTTVNNYNSPDPAAGDIHRAGGRIRSMPASA